MPIYNAPVSDMRYLLNDVLDIHRYSNLAGFTHMTPDIIDAVLQEGAKIAKDVLLPLNQSGDLEGCALDGGEVKTPKGFKDAYRIFVEGGWTSLTCDEAYGGQGLPSVLGVALNEMIISSNVSFSTYPGLQCNT